MRLDPGIGEKPGKCSDRPKSVEYAMLKTRTARYASRLCGFILSMFSYFCEHASRITLRALHITHDYVDL